MHVMIVTYKDSYSYNTCEKWQILASYSDNMCFDS